MITTTDTAMYVDNGNTVEFNCYLDIPMSRKLAFVDSVVDPVVGDDYYYPMLKDVMFDFRMVQFFTDIDTGVVDGDDTLDQMVEFLESTNAADVVKVSVNFDVVQELYDAVDKAIEYKTGIHPSPIADGIASILKMAEEKIAGIDVDSANAMAKVFGNMQGNITPDKMLEAYANSDVFKKMHGDVVKKQDERDKKAEDRLNVVKGNVSLDASDIRSHEDDKNAEKNFEPMNGLEIV
jgi:hypothetical protein